MLTLTTDRSVVQLVPELGAGLARFDVDGHSMFRRWDGNPSPFHLSSIVLVPWSNRISGGGFEFNGERFSLEPNLADETYPIHGNGFLERWSVTEHRDNTAVLTLRSQGPGPYEYEAMVSYRLVDASLTMKLEVTNQSERAMPFGLGFHPWLTRTAATALTANFSSVWLENSDHLPSDLVSLKEKPEWNFANTKRLPSGWINNAFAGWDGKATINWPEWGLGLKIDASEELRYALLFSPSAESDFFCFEPVGHAVNAPNLPGGAVAHGMVALRPQGVARASCRFSLLPTHPVSVSDALS